MLDTDLEKLQQLTAQLEQSQQQLKQDRLSLAQKLEDASRQQTTLHAKNQRAVKALRQIVEQFKKQNHE